MSGLREQETSLSVERAGHGGNRLTEIERQIAENEKTRAARVKRAEKFAELLAEAGLDLVETPVQFAARRGEIAAAHRATEQAIAGSQEEVTKAAVLKGKLDEEAAEANARAAQP